MTNDALQRLKIPAIGVLVTGILNILTALLILAGGVLRLTGLTGPEPVPTNEAERLGYYIGTFGGYGIAVLSLIVAPFIIYGALQMRKGRKLGLSRNAAILSLIPLTSCCFPIGLAFGLWALVVLGKPEVQAFFRGETSSNAYPPPPQNW